MGAGENNFIGIGLGGGGGVAPQTSSEPWPTTFTSTSGGGSTWTWTGPDGSDQSAHLTGGDGDLADYPVPGVHVIEEQDGGGNTTALHTITLGTEGWLVLGDGGKSLLDMTLSADPNSQIASRTATTITLDKTKPATMDGNNGATLSLPLTIPTGKRLRCRITRTSDTGLRGMVGVGICKDPTDHTDTISAVVHNEEYGGTARAGRMVLGGSIAWCNLVALQKGGEGTMHSGNDGSCIRWDVTQFNPATGTPNTSITDVTVSFDLDDVAYAVVWAFRVATVGADTTIGVKAEIQLY
jgi:hypothetical protein